MDDKQKVNSNEGFWSELDESDEDFETMIGMGKKSSENQEITRQEHFQDEKEKHVESKEVNEPIEISEDDQTTGDTITEEIVELRLPLVVNTEVYKSVESLESLKEATSFEISTKEKSSSVLEQSEFDCGEVDSESFGTTKKGPTTFSNTVLSAEKMDFLWDDEDEEDVFVQPKIKDNKETTIKEETAVDYKLLVKEKIFAAEEVPIKEETISPLISGPINQVENKVTDIFTEEEESQSKDHTISEKESDRHEEVEKMENFTPQEEVKPITQNKPSVKVPFAGGVLKKPVPKTIDSTPSPKKFDFSFQTPIVASINRYTILYSTFKQKRRNQLGEYVDKETNVVSTYEYSFTPRVSPKITLQNMLQLNDEYQDIIKILSLKDCHVDNVCKVLNVKDVVYSKCKYSEDYDSSDINTFIDLCLVDKNMAIDFACKKKMWSFALVISDNRPDVVKQFLGQTVEENMISLALSVVDKKDTGEIILDSDWKKYLKHILRIPFGEIHMKFLEKVGSSDEISLYTLLVCLHVLKLVNIGDFCEYYSKNFYMLQVVMFLDKHFTPVNNIGNFMYQYITVLYDFDKKASEEFYVENKRSFSSEIQSSLDQVFHVGGWGFGFKDVINFGISKILNVEEENKPVVTSDIGNKTIGPIDINRSKMQSSLNNKTVVPQGYNKNVEVLKESQEYSKSVEVIKEPETSSIGTPTMTDKGVSNIVPPNIDARKMSLAQGFKKVPVRQNHSLSNLLKARKSSKETYGAFEDIEKAVEGINLNEKGIKDEMQSTQTDNVLKPNDQNDVVNGEGQKEIIEQENHSEKVLDQKSKSVVINESRPLYSAQQHAKSFADIMDLEKPQKEFTTEDDTSLFLSKYNIDDNDGGLNKKKEEKKEEEQKSSFFSMFNIFKKNVYKVDLQASDDIKYDPVTKKWVSGNTQSAPQEVKKAVTKSIPLPSKAKPVAKSTVDVKNMSMYANRKSIGKAVIPGVSSIKKPSDKEDKM